MQNNLFRCPNCKKEISQDDIQMEYHKHGRKGDCPLCKKGILFTRQAKGFVSGQHGNLERRFKNAKRRTATNGK